jgi:hypothetical protein
MKSNMGRVLDGEEVSKQVGERKVTDLMTSKHAGDVQI